MRLASNVKVKFNEAGHVQVACKLQQSEDPKQNCFKRVGKFKFTDLICDTYLHRYLA